ncbi:MFS transporter [Candidatus Phycosocius spiralis]|uniref:MFS transporter n=1 Tax=Candidatus Phycosocius spiralis TaxID=2815099 RepID=UPI0024E0B775|nr:MFS transporter [Candidatus Phycosocius spiralis]
MTDQIAKSATDVSPAKTGAMIFIIATVVLDMLAIGMIVPIMPRLVESYFTDVTSAAHAFGLSMTLWALLQFFMSPVLGAMSDQFGRRPVILVSCLGLGLSYFASAWAPTFLAFLAARVISGATAGNISAANAYVADVTLPAERAKAFGMLGAAFGVGFTFGPAMGGLLGAIDVRLPLIVAGFLCFINAAYGFFVLPESHKLENRTVFNWGKANPVGALAVFKGQPYLYALIPVYGLFALAQNVFPSAFVLYAEHRYHFSTIETGATMAVSSTLMILAQLFIVQRVVGRLGERRSLMIALLFGMTGFALYGLAPTPILFWASMPVMTMWALFNPSIQSLMTQRVSADAQGQLQGGLASLMAMMGIFAPNLYTSLFAMGISMQWPGGIDLGIDLPGAPFLAASFFLAIALAITLLVVRRGPGSGKPL